MEYSLRLVVLRACHRPWLLLYLALSAVCSCRGVAAADLLALVSSYSYIIIISFHFILLNAHLSSCVLCFFLKVEGQICSTLEAPLHALSFPFPISISSYSLCIKVV